MKKPRKSKYETTKNHEKNICLKADFITIQRVKYITMKKHELCLKFLFFKLPFPNLFFSNLFFFKNYFSEFYFYSLSLSQKVLF